MRAAVLKCEKLPSFVTWDIPDLGGLFHDDRMLVSELEQRGIIAESIAWTDMAGNWTRFDAAILRSTWDYIDHLERFLAVMEEGGRSGCRLFNAPDAVRWNCHKSYLLDLQARGVPTVPTFRLEALDPGTLQQTIVQLGGRFAIMKPPVGAGAAGVRRVPIEDLPREVAALRAAGEGQDLLVQPLVETILTEGELSFVYIDGVLSHTLAKVPAPGDFRAHGIYGGTITRCEAGAKDAREAGAILRGLPFAPLYARLDLVRIGGRLAVMEVEVIEPMLYFDLAPESAGALADAVLSRL